MRTLRTRRATAETGRRSAVRLAFALALALLGGGGGTLRARAQSGSSETYYYCIERLSDGLVARRGTTTWQGVPQNGLILGPDRRYRFWLLQAATGLCGFTDFQTPGSGFSFEVPSISLSRSRAPDFDGDGLSDDGEFVVGTDPAKTDTDADGIADNAELRQGLDPLDGLNVRTGVLGGTDTPGDAQDVGTLNDVAVLADAGAGLTVFNIFNRMPPLVIGRIEIPGTALRVALSGNQVAVAAGNGGLAVVDITAPPDVRLMHLVRLSGAVLAVTAEGGLAFAGTETGQLAVVDMAGGSVLQRVRLDGPVQDLVMNGEVLHVLTRARLWTLASEAGRWTVTDQRVFPGEVGSTQRAFRLSTGPGLLYANDTRSVFLYDLSDPRHPAFRQRNVSTQLGWKQLIANGAGLGLAAVGPSSVDGTQDDVSLFDLGLDGTGLDLITIHPTPGTARAVSIYNGLGYVADGQSGLQVLNYLAYDQGTNPPTLALQGSFDPANPVVEESKFFRLSAAVQDDVQVRNVEFYLDGQRRVTDGNFPFTARLLAPALSPIRSTFTVRARATDTGGNEAWTPTLTVILVPDATPPGLGNSFPLEGGIVGGVDTVVAYFTEPLDPATLGVGVVQLIGAGPDGVLGTGDDLPAAGQVEYRDSLQAVFVTLAEPLSAGLWEAVVSRQIADLRGNRPPSELTWRFWVLGGGDRDQDGVPDTAEPAFGYDPDNPDSDADGVIDGEEDWDGDAFPNAWELAFALDPRLADGNGNGIPDGDEDPDLDSLSIRREFLVGTNPVVADSDGDGWNDESELTGGSLALDRRSTPFLWVGSRPAVRATVGAFGGASGYGLGLIAARPPASVIVPNFGGGSGAGAVTVARPPVFVALARALAGSDYVSGIAVARPPVSVGLARFEPGEAGAGVTLARPPVSVAVSRAEVGTDYAPGTTVARPPVSALAPESVVNPANGHRYYLLPLGTWQESEARAVALGGHLVTLDDQAEQDWVVATFARSGELERDLWCGLRDPDTVNNAATPDARKAEFQWVSGSPVVYQNWYPGQPDRYQGQEYFALLISAQNNTWAQSPNWRWNDAPAWGVAYGVAEVAP